MVQTAEHEMPRQRKCVFDEAVGIWDALEVEARICVREARCACYVVTKG